jgi:hypothetical protein
MGRMNLKHLQGLYDGTRHDPLIVCHIDQPTATTLGATRGRVLLTDRTMRKQVRKHDDLTLDHYRVLPVALMQGEYRRAEPNGAVVIFVDTVMFGCNFRAYVRTYEHAKLYVVSFNLLRDRHMAKERRKPYPIIREHD